MNGLILLPTLNRIEYLKNFLKSYEETKAETLVWLLIDQDDLEKHRAEYDALQKPPNVIIYNTEKNVTMGDKIRFAWGGVKGLNPKWVGLLNDDHYCVTPEWDKKVEALLDGTNMVSTNDGNWNFGIRVVGVTAWSMPLLEACRFPIFPGRLYHWFIDDVWKAIGDATGCWLETNKINIEHRHTFRGMMPADDTYKRSQDPQSAQYSLNEFQHFMKQDFKEVCERINKLRESQNLQEKFT